MVWELNGPGKLRVIGEDELLPFVTTGDKILVNYI